MTRCDDCRDEQYQCPDCDERDYQAAAVADLHRELTARSDALARREGRR